MCSHNSPGAPGARYERASLAVMPLSVSRRRCLFAAACILLGGSLSASLPRAHADDPSAAATVESRIAAIVGEPTYKHAHWGLLVVDLDGGETIYEHNADHLFAPASTTKLFSVAAAWDILGPDYTFETSVYARGNIGENGVLDGDVILVAGGDLSMGGRTQDDGRIAFTNSDHTYANGNTTAELTKPDPLAGIDELARQIVGAGLRRVKGNVLIDDRLFDKARGTGSGPDRLTPIIINDNLIDLQISPTAAGEPAKLEWRPKTGAFQVESKVQTVDADKPLITWIKEETPGHLVITGQIPHGHKPIVRVHEVDDAAAFARTLLIEALDRAGVVVEASAFGPNPDPATLPTKVEIQSWPRVALLKSPPFSESARLILKVSHNLQASTLPLLLAAAGGKRTLDEGLHRQREFLLRAGVDADSISFGGGAGGDKADFVTPRAVVQLLTHLSKRDDFDRFKEALPVLGSDGTLATYGADRAAKGKVFAKTGTLLWSNRMNGGYIMTSKALAGYIQTKTDRTFAFGFYVNNVHLKEGKETAVAGEALSRLCEVFYDDKPEAEETD